MSVVRSAEGRIEGANVDLSEIKLEMSVTPEFDELLTRLASELRGTKGQAILKGLALLQVALDAKQERKRLVVVDDAAGTEEDVNEV